ncbi:MAG TPA: hypothetical protein DEH78_14925 [Solibacterales bacterium]|nr:hypothetical protein [Bryobacterales bacterium]
MAALEVERWRNVPDALFEIMLAPERSARERVWAAVQYYALAPNHWEVEEIKGRKAAVCKLPDGRRLTQSVLAACTKLSLTAVNAELTRLAEMGAITLIYGYIALNPKCGDLPQGEGKENEFSPRGENWSPFALWMRPKTLEKLTAEQQRKALALLATLHDRYDARRARLVEDLRKIVPQILAAAQGKKVRLPHWLRTGEQKEGENIAKKVPVKKSTFSPRGENQISARGESPSLLPEDRREDSGRAGGRNAPQERGRDRQQPPARPPLTPAETALAEGIAGLGLAITEDKLPELAAALGDVPLHPFVWRKIGEKLGERHRFRSDFGCVLAALRDAASAESSRAPGGTASPPRPQPESESLIERLAEDIRNHQAQPDNQDLAEWLAAAQDLQPDLYAQALARAATKPAELAAPGGRQ